MEREKLIRDFRTALSSIVEPRLFETERGFQGALLAEMHRLVPLPVGTVIEQEYQKRLRQHGLSQRPDIIIHEPFDPTRHRTPADGNHAVVELKLRATAAHAIVDFDKLSLIRDVLEYPLAIFVNIGSAITHANVAPPSLHGFLVCFAVYRDGVSVGVIEDRT
ncbi:hypothetical protein HHL24_30915 [Paraburkholderia sp. RP-4-7]|uniref:Uncharacterized protein n=1 Tax=Paraburkholderia polaris TaxID=2728848 RepID=A0A848IMI8_9BURK|nr:hypothetical protein [Paraburkholderia polaris]NMM02323.1 hypothetical protein [Paraburkholderia polaris]